MDILKSFCVPQKPLKSLFISVQATNAFLSLATLLLLRGYIILPISVTLPDKVPGVILGIMVGLALLSGANQKRKLAKIVGMSDFDSKVVAYQSFYRNRMLWFLFSCLVASVIGVLSGRMIFFYFALADIALALPYYPSLLLIRREMKNDDIIFC